jgi:hypothetical protein
MLPRCMSLIITDRTSAYAVLWTSPGPSRGGRSSCRPGPRKRHSVGRRECRGGSWPPKHTLKLFYSNLKGRAASLGRDPENLKIFPACFVVGGDTAAEAHKKRARLDSLVHADSAIASLSIALGYDVSKLDPEGPLPVIQSASHRVCLAFVTGIIDIPPLVTSPECLAVVLS